MTISKTITVHEQAYQELMHANSNSAIDRERLIDTMVQENNPVWAYNVIKYNSEEFYHFRITRKYWEKLIDVIALGNNTECAYKALKNFYANDGYRFDELASKLGDKNDPRWAYEVLVNGKCGGSGIVKYWKLYVDTVISHGSPEMIAHVLLQHARLDGTGNIFNISLVNKAVDKIIDSENENYAAMVRHVTICRPLYYPVYDLFRRTLRPLLYSIDLIQDNRTLFKWQENKDYLEEIPRYLVTTRARLKKLKNMGGSYYPPQSGW